MVTGGQAMIKSSSRLVPCLLLVACSAVEPPEETTLDPKNEARRNMILDGSSLTTAELVLEIDRLMSLARAEMGSVHEPIVRAQVEEETYRIEIAEAGGGGLIGTESGGTYILGMRRLDNGSLIRVHVPDDVSLSKGDVLDVVVGQHGYYFERIIESE